MSQPRENPGAVLSHRDRVAGEPVLADPAATRSVPEATVVRLAVYLRVLLAFSDTGRTTVSSEELAAAAGVGSAKLRKDLSFLGSNGTRGVGYDVPRLVVRLETTLGLDRKHRVVLVGAGNLGHALAGYDGFGRRGFDLAALFDNDADLVGEQVSGTVVRHLDELDAVCADLGVTIGVVATPGEAAQDVCDRLVAAGVRCILNFAPVVLQVPAEVDVRKVDLAIEMQVLSFHMARRAAELLGDGAHEIDPAAAAAGRGSATRNGPVVVP